MTKPVVILDPDWRQMDELFSPAAKKRLFEGYDIIWGQEGGIPAEVLSNSLPVAEILIAATPRVSQETLEAAPNLHTVIEVSGAFPDTIDYRACAARGVEVLTCAPGFRQSVAEMGLAMALGLARGLITEHEAFRRGSENWLNDMPARDFTLFGAQIGFVGFGQIAREMMRLLAPFRPDVSVFDPWLPQEVAQSNGVSLCCLDDVMRGARCVFITAVPTADNFQMISADVLSGLQDGALVVLLSRAHLVDFDALTAEVSSGRIRAAVDVFPSEPLAKDDPVRRLEGVLLSPHRAAAVAGGRHLIGDMILADLARVQAGERPENLGRADADRIDALAGVGDAVSVAAMATER